MKYPKNPAIGAYSIGTLAKNAKNAGTNITNVFFSDFQRPVFILYILPPYISLPKIDSINAPVSPKLAPTAQ